MLTLDFSYRTKKGARKNFVPSYTWEKGDPRNPAGQKRVPEDVKEAARAHTLTALQTLVDVCTKGRDEKARIAAATAILDRAWGKPSESHSWLGKNGQPVDPGQVVQVYIPDNQR